MATLGGSGPTSATSIDTRAGTLTVSADVHPLDCRSVTSTRRPVRVPTTSRLRAIAAW